MDGCRPETPSEVTITLLQSNTDLNRLRHNQREWIAQIQRRAREQSILLISGDENGSMGTERSDEMR